MSRGHAAIVLAAGGSRRLGRAKQLLMREGETLVHRAVRLAASTGAVRIVVVVGSDHERISAAIAGLDAEVVINPHWENGLATSLQTAARVLHDHADQVVILGCDQPALELEHLQQLVAGAGTAPSGCSATQHGDQLGTPVVVPATLLRTAEQLHGDRGFGAYLNALAPDAVWRLHAPELHLDIDNPENQQAAIARGLLDIN
jgi:molybdenum cofactor cytidylyltransferase